MSPPASQPPVPPRSLLGRFDLAADQAGAGAIDDAMRAGVGFRGTNLWLLIFAIIIASVGLNVNSTAVIIGAMLVSPLMGPIMGAGYGAAIADFALVRLALWNLLIATLVSLVVSGLYFWATPLAAEHSELLARTSPTIWDVVIALFGGLAGIVGVTRRDKSNVIPGVAIATALMPPLCTAGYGLATMNVSYFAGAFYLFCINSVFIAAATFIMVRLMGLPELVHTDAAAARRSHRLLALLVALTALPSVFLAQQLVAAEVYEARANAFVASAFPPEGESFVVARDLSFAKRQVRLTVVGAPVTPERREALTALLPAAGLDETSLVINQSEQSPVDLAVLRQDIVQEMYQRTLSKLDERDRTIAELRVRLDTEERAAIDVGALEREVAAQHPEFGRVAVLVRMEGDTRAIALLIERAKPIPVGDRDKLVAWLKVRTGVSDAWVVVVPPEAPARGAAP